jgi:hypothetical protein
VVGSSGTAATEAEFAMTASMLPDDPVATVMRNCDDAVDVPNTHDRVCHGRNGPGSSGSTYYYYYYDSCRAQEVLDDWEMWWTLLTIACAIGGVLIGAAIASSGVSAGLSVFCLVLGGLTYLDVIYDGKQAADDGHGIVVYYEPFLGIDYPQHVWAQRDD